MSMPLLNSIWESSAATNGVLVDAIVLLFISVLAIVVGVVTGSYVTMKATEQGRPLLYVIGGELYHVAPMAVFLSIGALIDIFVFEIHLGLAVVAMLGMLLTSSQMTHPGYGTAREFYVLHEAEEHWTDAWARGPPSNDTDL